MHVHVMQPFQAPGAIGSPQSAGIRRGPAGQCHAGGSGGSPSPWQRGTPRRLRCAPNVVVYVFKVVQGPASARRRDNPESAAAVGPGGPRRAAGGAQTMFQRSQDENLRAAGRSVAQIRRGGDSGPPGGHLIVPGASPGQVRTAACALLLRHECQEHRTGQLSLSCLQQPKAACACCRTRAVLPGQ